MSTTQVSNGSTSPVTESAPAFPSFYRRKPLPDAAQPTTDDGVNEHGSHSLLSDQAPPSLQPPSAMREKNLVSIGVGETERVAYAPMPEHRRLGYFSVASLIINKMIGTGIFSQPASVLEGTGGSKGAALLLWVVGGIMTLAGLLIYLEFGILLPYNGGEFIYLQESYTRPRYLAGCVFAMLFVLVGNTAPNCFIFAQYIVGAFDPDQAKPNTQLLKFVALVVISFICTLHVFSRKLGILANNALAVYKVTLLTFVCVTGFAVLGGARVGGNKNRHDDYGVKNFDGSFHTSAPTTPYGYAWALLDVLFAFRGWENANYVLSEVKRPRGHESRTFKRGVLFAFCLVSALYLLANIAYFAASSVYEIKEASINVAAEFFGNVFGQGSFVKRGLRVFIALSAFGNLISTTYAHSRVEQEFAKQRILPFSKYWARNSPYGTPVGALTLHWVFTVILILATPNDTNGEAYGLVGNLFVYGQAWVAVFIAIGLATLRYHNKYREWKPAVIKNFELLYFIAAFYVLFNLFIIVLIWWPAPAYLNRTISSYVTPGVSTCLLVFGVLYWFCFAKVLPALGYEIDDEPEELADGTRVVTYKRHKTGFAKRLDDWWIARFGGRFGYGSKQNGKDVE